MKTFVPSAKGIERKWYLIDASDKVLGNISTEIAKILRGKNKSTFTPHLDLGDGVIVINAEKIVLTGKKWDQKTYFSYSGYIGNLRQKPARKVHSEKPTFLLEQAVAGMIPKTRLKKDILLRLKVYAGSEHPHDAQKPEPLAL